MNERKKHLRYYGLSRPMCKQHLHGTYPRYAKTYAEVSCRRCIQTETYTRYLEGLYKEKPESYEQDCASGYFRTGKRVEWLQRIVDEFNPEEALKLANDWNQELKGLPDKVQLDVDTLLKFISNTWALLAINKELSK